MKKIAIVLGHRKDKPGAYSPFLKEYEYEFNSGLLYELSIRLRDFDTCVYLKDGLTTEKVYEEIAKRKPDIAIELHFNSHLDSSAYGTETLCLQGYGYYAKIMQNAISAALMRDKDGDRGIKICDQGDRGYDNISLLSCCTLLLEPFFGSNQKDCNLIVVRRKEFLDAIEAALRQILRNPIPDQLLP